MKNLVVSIKVEELVTVPSMQWSPTPGTLTSPPTKHVKHPGTLTSSATNCPPLLVIPLTFFKTHHRSRLGGQVKPPVREGHAVPNGKRVERVLGELLAVRRRTHLE